MKKVSGNVSVFTVDEMLNAVREYRQWLKRKTAVFLEQLSSEGLQVARAGFKSAAYDGVNDVNVTVDVRPNGVAVVAIGSSVLFIEFGTGVTYPDNHPEASSLGMVRGGYGKGNGKKATWGYYGHPGTSGKVVVNSKGKEVVLTHGNPANMPMYNAVKSIKSKIEKIANEVYK